MTEPGFIRSAATREDVVRAALSWEGTPFHDCCRVKGAGVDCVNLIIATYSEVGLIADFNPEPYKPQWFQHRDEPRFLLGLEAHARRIEPSAALIGDVLMYAFGRHAAHGAIVVDETTIVHAYKPVGRVTRGDRRELEHRLDSAWTLFP